MPRSVVLITGLPGAALYKPVAVLRARGWALTWPAQNLSLYGAQSWVSHGTNPEVANMHLDLLHSLGRSWLTFCAPRYYDQPYPGPAEFLAQFPADQHVVVADYLLCFFLPLWLPVATNLVVCEVAPATSAQFCHERTGKKAALDECRKVVHHYESRLQEWLVRHGDAVRLSESALQDGSYQQQLHPLFRTSSRREADD